VFSLVRTGVLFAEFVIVDAVVVVVVVVVDDDDSGEQTGSIHGL